MTSTIEPKPPSAPVVQCLVPELLHLHIQWADGWRVATGPDGQVYRPVRLASKLGPALDKVYYSAEQLGALDPRVPEVLHLLIRSNTAMVASNLRATLRLWNNELTQLPINMFENFKITYHAELSSFTASVVSKRFPNNLGDSVSARFLGFETAYTAAGTLYVEKCMQPHFVLSNTWLDEHRPGWRATLAMAKALDLSEEQFAQMLLFTPLDKLSNNQELPGLDLP
jgi:hypothetical protein